MLQCLCLHFSSFSLPFLLVYWMILTNLQLKAGESLFSKRKNKTYCLNETSRNRIYHVRVFVCRYQWTISWLRQQQQRIYSEKSALINKYNVSADSILNLTEISPKSYLGASPSILSLLLSFKIVLIIKRRLFDVLPIASST